MASMCFGAFLGPKNGVIFINDKKSAKNRQILPPGMVLVFKGMWTPKLPQLPFQKEHGST